MNISINSRPYTTTPFCFYGDPDSPFLAPRGVWLTQKYLLVSDTGRNRIFIWSHPEQPHLPPSLILGQDHQGKTERNQGGKVSASTLQYPSGIWSDGKTLVVADAWNHRVLIWHSFPTKNGQAADVVLGQPNFEQNQPNVKGVGSSPDAQTLYWPYGVFSDGTHLWIADTGNRRVLFYEEIPAYSYKAADRVIGQADFTTKDYDTSSATWPYAVKLGPNGELAIVDTNAYRVLVWKHYEEAFSDLPSIILGQPHLDAKGQNQFKLFPEAYTLNWCYDVLFYREGIWVADAGNSRILGWDQLPTTHNQPAQHLIGQASFQLGGENQYNMHSTEHTLYWPFSLASKEHLMAVADTGNHRIIYYSISS